MAFKDLIREIVGHPIEVLCEVTEVFQDSAGRGCRDVWRNVARRYSQDQNFDFFVAEPCRLVRGTGESQEAGVLDDEGADAAVREGDVGVESKPHEEERRAGADRIGSHDTGASSRSLAFGDAGIKSRIKNVSGEGLNGRVRAREECVAPVNGKIPMER